MSPADRNFALGLYDKFQPRFGDEKRSKIQETSSGSKFEKKSQHGDTQKMLTLAPIKASATLKTVSLQLNGILMMWRIQQATQDDAFGASRNHGLLSSRQPCCSYGKISSSQKCDVRLS